MGSLSASPLFSGLSAEMMVFYDHWVTPVYPICALMVKGLIAKRSFLAAAPSMPLSCRISLLPTEPHRQAEIPKFLWYNGFRSCIVLIIFS